MLWEPLRNASRGDCRECDIRLPKETYMKLVNGTETWVGGDAGAHRHAPESVHVPMRTSTRMQDAHSCSVISRRTHFKHDEIHKLRHAIVYAKAK